MKSLFLIGFMGSGKTSVMVSLARKLGLPYIDTDKAIEEEQEQRIPAIFEEEGEAAFRKYESEILQKMPKLDTVIATGGGIVEKEKNREWLKRNGTIVYLHTSLQEINKRLAEDQSRPLWKRHDKTALYTSRLAKYEDAATVRVTTDFKTPEQIADEIIELIKKQQYG
ncbi:shikimate kinase [Sediminibacillus albus]|uniref:Shikimate kinase n=1 Tax=Sediminibacillus albus TaxID=407036 RepID=A0A1G9CU85_9BACI|nr:shikimate kinase [Sediminibacillus albus]SDK55232.1 shikimate kinase [Sediminibacillus albus]